MSRPEASPSRERARRALVHRATIAFVLLVQLAKVRRPMEPSRRAPSEMAAAPTALASGRSRSQKHTAGGSADTGPRSGGFIVLATTVVIGLRAEALGKELAVS